MLHTRSSSVAGFFACGEREREREKERIPSLVATRNVRLTTQWSNSCMIDGSLWIKRPASIVDSDALSFAPKPRPFFCARGATSLSIAVRGSVMRVEVRHARIQTLVTRRSHVTRLYTGARVCLSAEKDLLEDIWPRVFTDMASRLIVD